MIHVEYDSNNSGGHWPLSDADWRALEAAGWTVNWRALQCTRCYQTRAEITAERQAAQVVNPVPLGFAFCSPGHPEHRFEERWLDALATSATCDAPSLRAAIEQWAQITGCDPADDGCSCCGRPHNFRGEDTDTGETHYPRFAYARTTLVWDDDD